MGINRLPHPSRRRLLAAVLAVAALLAGCAAGTAPAVPAGVRAALAPTGTLRVAVYPGSPTSLTEQAPSESMRGVSVDLGRALAARLGVPAQIAIYPRLAQALEALQRGEADFTITNATDERARIVDFGPALIDLELGVLVPAVSRIKAVEQLDLAGATVGVTQGSSSERVLSGKLKQAGLRAFPTLDAARAALQAGQIDAFATNKGILFELLERVPGARVLDGRWGVEHLAPAIPKGRETASPYLRAFTEDVRRNGELDRASRRAGLRVSPGARPPP
ncbi:MAG: transporter substrate-binding domain-containing protein [Burkholderiales bacterium]|nr:transporter substrate-binding domain-containing protein [Burkholderiales bacterium]